MPPTGSPPTSLHLRDIDVGVYYTGVINYYSILGLYWDNGKDYGNYYSILGLYWVIQRPDYALIADEGNPECITQDWP